MPPGLPPSAFISGGVDQLSAVSPCLASSLMAHGSSLPPPFIRIHLRPRSHPARRLFSPAAPSATHWPDLSPVSWLANFRHSFRCFRQSNIAAIGRIACSRIGSRPRSTRGRNRRSSWISGARKFRFMICVTRARLTWPRRANSCSRRRSPRGRGGPSCLRHQHS